MEIYDYIVFNKYEKNNSEDLYSTGYCCIS